MGKSTYQLVIFPLPRAAPPGPPTHSEPVLAPTRPRRTKHDFCDQHIFGQRWENGTFLKFYHQNTGNMRIEAIKGMILRKHLGLKPWFSRFSCGFSLIQLLDSWFQAHPQHPSHFGIIKCRDQLYQSFKAMISRKTLSRTPCPKYKCIKFR